MSGTGAMFLRCASTDEVLDNYLKTIIEAGSDSRFKIDEKASTSEQKAMEKGYLEAYGRVLQPGLTPAILDEKMFPLFVRMLKRQPEVSVRGIAGFFWPV